MRIIPSIACLLGLFFSLHAEAAATDQRATIISLLNAYGRGVSAAQWQRLSIESAPILLDLYQDSSSPLARRLRILDALKYFPTAAAQKLLATTADDRQTDSLLRRQAISSLVQLNGVSELPRLKRLQHDADWRLRRRVGAELKRLKKRD